ncbi:MAG: hypothetical protein JOZ24_07550 [Candidatus Eremiobacteraeota bacterium]|nr:hypothetical protein [Candidatus Eremiobacteraeota bacterium]
MPQRPEVDAEPEARGAVDAVLDRFGAGALRVAAANGTRLVVLQPSESYCGRSSVLRRLGAAVDAWPVPPAGLFVVEERTVYLRSTSPMTVAHEFAHALDCALGGGVYLSGVDPRVRNAFERTRRFITPYAASGLDEYFAECLRAWVEANDGRSPWPPATRARLLAVDPAMAQVCASLFVHDLGL